MVIRKTTVIDESLKLPRPKVTQDIVAIGPKDECQEILDRIALDAKNHSTDQIEVDMYITLYKGQKTGTSSRPNNGKR